MKKAIAMMWKLEPLFPTAFQNGLCRRPKALWVIGSLREELLYLLYILQKSCKLNWFTVLAICWR